MAERSSPLRLKAKGKNHVDTEAVLHVDIHSNKQRMLACVATGRIRIHDYPSLKPTTFVKDIGCPVRAAKFIPGKQWVAAGADDRRIYVYDYTSSADIKIIDAHGDHIRFLACHDKHPYLFSCSDDMTVKLWNVDNWACLQTFVGHDGPVMQIALHPFGKSIFASASHDSTVKVWNINHAFPVMSLDDCSEELNCVSYFWDAKDTYLIAGSEKTMNIWHDETGVHVDELSNGGHISSICMHPELRAIIVCYENGEIHVRNTDTYRFETVYNCGSAAVHTFSCIKGSSRVVVGNAEGMLIIKIDLEKPIASFCKTGEILWAKHDKIQIVHIQSAATDDKDSAVKHVSSTVKDFSICEFTLESLKYSPNGEHVLVCGDQEYVLSSSEKWTNIRSGAAVEAVWSSDGCFAVFDNLSQITIFDETFKEKRTFNARFPTKHIFGGTVLAACSCDTLCFYGWADALFLWQFHGKVKSVYWADGMDLVAIACDTSCYILKYNRDVVSTHINSSEAAGEEAVPGSFDTKYQIKSKVKSGFWVEDFFVYNDSSSLRCCFNDVVTRLCRLEQPIYIVGYKAEERKLILIDKKLVVSEYCLPLSFMKYEQLVTAGDVVGARKFIPSIPESRIDSVVKFLVARELDEEALRVAIDPGFRFRVALKLKKLSTALDMVYAAPAVSKWKMLAEAAVSSRMVNLDEANRTALEQAASEYDEYQKSNSEGSLLHYLQASGKMDRLEGLVEASLVLNEQVEQKLFGKESMEEDDIELLSKLSALCYTHQGKVPPSKLLNFVTEKLIRNEGVEEDLVRYKIRKLREAANAIGDQAIVDEDERNNMLWRLFVGKKRKRRGRGT